MISGAGSTGTEEFAAAGWLEAEREVVDRLDHQSPRGGAGPHRRERRVDEQVVLHGLEPLSDLGGERCQLVGHRSALGAGGVTVGLSKLVREFESPHPPLRVRARTWDRRATAGGPACTRGHAPHHENGPAVAAALNPHRRCPTGHPTRLEGRWCGGAVRMADRARGWDGAVPAAPCGPAPWTRLPRRRPREWVGGGLWQVLVGDRQRPVDLREHPPHLR